MDKKYSDKYSALRAAAAARQRRSGSERGNNSGNNKNPFASSTTTAAATKHHHHSKIDKNKVDDELLKYQRLQQLQHQQQQHQEQEERQRRHTHNGSNSNSNSGVAMSNDNHDIMQQQSQSSRRSQTIHAVVSGAREFLGNDNNGDDQLAQHGKTTREKRTTAHYAEGISRKESNDSQQQQQQQQPPSSSFPPRQLRPTSGTTTAPSLKSSQQQQGGGIMTNNAMLATPAMKRTSSSTAAAAPHHQYTTPHSTAFEPSGRPPLQQQQEQEHYQNDMNTNDIIMNHHQNTATSHIPNSNNNNYNSLLSSSSSSPPPPKTPLTMMRTVMDSIHRDRSEIEGARRGGPLFGATADNGGGGGDIGVVHPEQNSNSNDHYDYSHAENDNNDARMMNGQEEGWEEHDEMNQEEQYHDDYDQDEVEAMNQMKINKNTNTENEMAYEQRQFNSTNCLPYNSEIVIRFRNPTVLASVSLQPRNITSAATIVNHRATSSTSSSRMCFVANEAHETLGGIGMYGENRFVLVKNQQQDGGGGGGSNSMVGNSEEEETTMECNDQTDISRNYLCYGDKVTLRSGVMRRVLGVQKEKIPEQQNNDDNNANINQQVYKLEVGCFRREGRFPQANSWTILRGGANAPVVQLGCSSLDTAAMFEQQQQQQQNGKKKRQQRIPVYSGDPIVLRNDWTGGLLSLGNECQLPLGATTVDGRSTSSIIDDDGTTPAGWSLKIITSTYQMNMGAGGGASTESDRPLIEYLHEHNQCHPGRKETFQILAADMPPACPNWAYPTTGEPGMDRIYLGGTYLSHPARHDGLGFEMEAEMFPEVVDPTEGGKVPPPQDWPRLAELSVDVQEKILMDEIIGAMMGQEGRFLRYQQLAVDEDDDEDESQTDYNMITDEPAFVFASPSFLGGNIDSSLENIVMRMLPLCTNYAYVNRYVASCLNHYECGVIARALCEAMNVLLEEYLVFVSNLDYMSRWGEESIVDDDQRKQLTMSMVHVHTQPSIRTMAILSQVVSTVRGKKGGELLNSLYSLMSLNYSGNEKGSELLQHLLTKCAAPYANMLQSWLRRGKVHDPYGEFMIEVTDKTFRENHVTIKQGMEWTDWCREKDEHVLKSLHDSNEDIVPLGNALGVDRSRATSHMSAMHKAHATGKYWRAIHCCHDGAASLTQQQRHKKEHESSSDDDGAKVLLNPLKLSRCINLAYHEASDTLLRMLLDEYGLLSSLQFMKKYFLLDQGDFFVDFLDSAEDELHKELPNVLQGRVQNWLTTSLARTSETSSTLASALRCSFQNKSLRDTLDDLGKRNHRKSSKKNTRQKVLAGFEAIAFEFKSVPFPTSIVLSGAQLRIYQLIFRLIFFAKYVERQLVSMWSDHQLLKAMMSLRAACSPTFSLRRRMLHFIQNFVYYLKFDVIEPNWRELESKLNATKEYCSNNNSSESKNGNLSNNNGQFPRTVDDLLHDHNQFLLRISGQCLLTNFDLIERASKIMTTCLLFSTQIKRFMETTKVHDLQEKTRLERSKLRYGGKKSKNGDQDRDFRAERGERTQRCSDRILRELCTETYRHMITRFDEVFSAHLAEFMKNLNSDFGQKDNAHLTNLSMQLDYNGFVSSSMPAKE